LKRLIFIFFSVPEDDSIGNHEGGENNQEIELKNQSSSSNSSSSLRIQKSKCKGYENHIYN